MLPLSIQNRFKRPGQMEREFMNYLKEANLTFDNSKTIASVEYYHQAVVVGNSNINFFTGNFNANDTNLVGSFVRPQSEHAVIYGIRVHSGASATLEQTAWVPGYGIAALRAVNGKTTITNNSEVELKNFPSTAWLNTLTTKDDGLFLLDEPIIWAGQTELKYTLDLITAEVLANYNVRISLVGIGLI